MSVGNKKFGTSQPQIPSYMSCRKNRECFDMRQFFIGGLDYLKQCGKTQNSQ
jgi:hypothetical protein